MATQTRSTDTTMQMRQGVGLYSSSSDKQYGFFPDTTSYRHGSYLYEKPDSTRVYVTSVSSNPFESGCKWSDERCVGEVCKYITSFGRSFERRTFVIPFTSPRRNIEVKARPTAEELEKIQDEDLDTILKMSLRVYARTAARVLRDEHVFRPIESVYDDHIFLNHLYQLCLLKLYLEYNSERKRRFSFKNRKSSLANRLLSFTLEDVSRLLE